MGKTASSSQLKTKRLRTFYWKTILKLEKEIRGFSGSLSFVCLNKEEVFINKIPSNFNDEILFVQLDNENKLPDNYPVFRLENILKIESSNTQSLNDSDLLFLKIYLPYCFLSYFSKKLKRCISVTHFAQSLDGKIATNSGDSRWIGNDENLDHAHRMRALCDGILVGNNTVRNDQPSLTVRRVEGEHPQRIIIGSSEVDLTSLMSCSPNSILVVSNDANYTSKQVEHLRVPSDNCRINSQDLLNLLFEKGIHSVYIEGGATTTSNFLKDEAVDVLQLHISPLVFGSGKQGIVLPSIDQVTDSPTFKYSKFHMFGDAVMFVGMF